MIKTTIVSKDDNLQILRFVAAALVLATHLTLYLQERVNAGIQIWHGGEIGVPIFFVISGFVMYLSGNSLDRNASGASFFLARRAARIFPMYWLVTTVKLVIALAVPAVALHNRPDLLTTLASYALYPMHNMAGEVRPLHGVGWTLLHEMLFYYVFSLSLLLRQSAFVFSSIIIAGLWVVGRFVEADTALEQVAYSPLNLLFIAGMVLAWQYQLGRRLPRWVASIALLFGVLTIVSAELLSSVRGVFGEFRVSAVLIVAAALSLPISGISRIKKTLVGLGDSSYSLYLLHPIAAPLICVALTKAHIGSPVLIFVIAFMLCVAGAHIVYLVVERKLNQAAWTALKNLLGARLAAPTFVKK